VSSALEILFHEREIQRRLCLFAEAMDRREWQFLDEVLLTDATGDFGEGHRPHGREAIVAMFKHFLGSCGPTQHLIGNLVVEIEGQRAHSRCYVRDMHQGAGDKVDLTFSSPGMYEDDWVLTVQGWRIAHRTKINLMMIGSIEALGVEHVNPGRPM
jgi:hypothetical protein